MWRNERPYDRSIFSSLLKQRTPSYHFSNHSFFPTAVHVRQTAYTAWLMLDSSKESRNANARVFYSIGKNFIGSLLCRFIYRRIWSKSNIVSLYFILYGEIKIDKIFDSAVQLNYTNYDFDNYIFLA